MKGDEESNEFPILSLTKEGDPNRSFLKLNWRSCGCGLKFQNKYPASGRIKVDGTMAADEWDLDLNGNIFSKEFRVSTRRDSISKVLDSASQPELKQIR